LKSDVIQLDKQFQGYNGSSSCLMLIDGTNCPVFELWPFEMKWYSQKLNGPAVKYEVGVCIKTGFIFWINGPFHGGENDGTIFKETLSGLLAEDEAVEVDSGYVGDDKFKGPTVATS
jgi:hypothetical protein